MFNVIKVHHLINPTFRADEIVMASALQHVASVTTERNIDTVDALSQVLDYAWILTNSVEECWTRAARSNVTVTPQARRSTSVGDVMELVPEAGDSSWYVVAPVGFKRINAPF